MIYKNYIDLLLLKGRSLSLDIEDLHLFKEQVWLMKQYLFLPKVQKICWISKAETETDPSCLKDKAFLQVFSCWILPISLGLKYQYCTSTAASVHI